MEMLIFSVHTASTKLPESHLGSESDLRPISTELTFKLKPLIEHGDISLAVCSTVPGSRGSAFTGGVGGGGQRTQEPGSSSHIAPDRRGSWLGLKAPNPSLKCTQEHSLEHVP